MREFLIIAFVTIFIGDHSPKGSLKIRWALTHASGAHIPQPVSPYTMNESVWSYIVIVQISPD